MMKKERRAGRGRPENVLSLPFEHVSFVLSFTSLFPGGHRRKGTGKPHNGDIVVRGLLRMTPDGIRFGKIM